jgi:hypothetical protein
MLKHVIKKKEFHFIACNDKEATNWLEAATMA